MELDQFKDVYLVIDKANNSFVQKQFVSQGDYKGRTLTVQITNNGSVGEVPGITLNLNWHNEASGITDLTAFNVLDKANSIFRIEYPQNMMTPGKVYASIQVIQDGKVTNLQQFELIVQKLAGQPVGIPEKAEFSALVAVLADANKFRTDIDKKADKTFVTAQLAQTNRNLNTGLAAKISKGENESISKAMLTQDFRDELANGKFTFSGNTSDIEDGAITAQKRTNLGEMGAIFSASAPNFDFNDKVLRIEKPFRMIYRNKFYIIGDDLTGDYYTISLENPDNFNQTYGVVYFNTETKLFSVRDNTAIKNGSVSESDVLIAWFRETSNSAGMVGPFTINEKIPQPDGSVTSSKRTMLGETGMIHSSTSYPDFDFNNKTLTIAPPIRIYHRNTYYTVNDQDTDLVIDLDDTTFRTYKKLNYGIITFHTPSETFRVRDTASLKNIDEYELVLGSYSCKDEELLFMNGTCTINGILPATTEGFTDIANLPDLFEVGTINTNSDGQNSPLTTSIRSKGYHFFKKGTKVKRLGGEIAIWFYDLETKDWLNGKEIGYPGPVDYSFSEDSLVRFVINGYDGSIKETLSTVSILQYSSDALNELTEAKTEEYEEDNSAQPYWVNDSGKELVFKLPITLNNSYMSDHTFVGDELWLFPVSNDDHTNWSTVMRYSVDVENKTATLLGTFDHNWGHVNSIDYNENTDALVCGNGGGSGNTQPNEFYVFENASQLKNIAQVDVHEHAIVYQVEQDGFDWGKQLNTTWGQANGGKHNIVYTLSNYNSATGTADNSVTSSDTQVIHKVLLGQGTNQLESGTFIEGKSGLEYNGTYKVLKKYTHPYKYDYANQGTTFYNGRIYEGISHDRLSYFEKILDDSGEVKSILNRERLFDDTGAELGLVVEGLAIKDDLLYLGEDSNSTIIYVYKL